MFGGNNNGYQPVSMIEPRNPYLAQPQPKKRKPIFTIIVVSVCALLLIVVVVLVALNKKEAQPTDDDEYAEFVPDEPTDDTGEADKLNSRLAELVKNNPNVNYQTKSKLVDWSDREAYATLRTIINDNALTEERLLKEFPEATSVEAMNANIINYYLDKGYIIAVYAKGDFPFSAKGQYIVIYGSQPPERYFLTCRYENYDSGGMAAEDMLASKHLFDALPGDAKFYVIGVR